MNFHSKVLIGFVFWHLVITAGGLIKGTLDYVEPTNDPDWVIEGVWRPFWILMSLMLSLTGVALAYLCRALFVLVVFVRRKFAQSDAGRIN